MEINQNESTRLACASAVLRGSLFRRRILNQARDRYRATAPEMGIDSGLLLLVCSSLESRETRYQLAYLACFLSIFPAGVIAGPLGPLLVLMTVFIIHFSKAYVERFDILRLFREEAFDPEMVAQFFSMDLDPELVHGVPLSRQNVLIHRQFNPFVGLGDERGSWSFSLDVTRSDNPTGKGSAEPFEAAELYGAVHAAVKKLGVPRLEIRDCLLVNGSDLREESELLPDPFCRPNQRIGATLLRTLRGHPGANQRHYKWVTICDWGGEMVFSYFFRFVTSGQTLYVETIQFLLAPLADHYREIDRIFLPNWLGNIFWFVKTVASTVFRVSWSLTMLFIKWRQWIVEFLGIEDWLQRWQIAYDPKYNYGPARSLRQDMRDRRWQRFFQKSDCGMYEKTLNREVLDAIADFLMSRNVDTSEIKERQATILNNGILIQGGNIRAGAIAVGKKAKVGLAKKLLARARPGRAK